MGDSSANGKDPRLTQQPHSASEGASNNKGRNLEVHIATDLPTLRLIRTATLLGGIANLLRANQQMTYQQPFLTP
jgi:hypothetical protein